MYINILKKDLKRKKTMNVILLLFVILASMFVSSSTNNIISVATALDDYFEMAGVPDFFAEISDNSSIDDIINDVDAVSSYKTEPLLYFADGSKFTHNGEELDINMPTLTSFSDRCINFYDSDNNEISVVEKGETYLPKYVMDNNKLSLGDTITIDMDDKKLDLKIKGYSKDAFLGSSAISMSRFILNDNDFNYITNDRTDLSGSFYYINTDDTSELSNKLSDCDLPILFMGDRDTIKLTYFMDEVIAASILIVSVGLILIAFAVLRFSINFTLEEEYREIGVMKAIGIKNGKIRRLYLVKFFVISCVGAFIGFFFGIPFGKMLLSSASQNMIIGNDSRYYINVLCSFLVVIVVMLFCFWCTRKIKKFTPIDAVRSGTTGERFKKKSKLSLAKSHFKPIPFIALNDILSNLKRYVVMALVFIFGITVMMILSNTGNTITDSSILNYMGVLPGDAYMSFDDYPDYYTDANEKLYKRCMDVENKLDEHNMSATCYTEIVYKLRVRHNGNSYLSQTYVGINTDTSDYEYIEGTAPQNKNEIALTPLVCEKIGADIGDTVTITDGENQLSFVVTAKFQTLTNLGEGVRLYNDVKLNNIIPNGYSGILIRFNDNPSAGVLSSRIDTLKELYPKATVYDSFGYMKSMIGDIAEPINNLKYLIAPICLMICMLVIVLMERSFISKEKGEIAMLKSIGFKNSSIVLIHTLRIAYIMIVSIIIGAAISLPITNLAAGPCFKMMGMQNVNFIVNIPEVFILYPAAMFICTITAAVLTALCTRKISTSEIANIE